MTQLISTVSSNLFHRRGDNRYADLPTLLAAARTRRDRSMELDGIPPSACLFVPTEGDDPDPIALTIDHSRASSIARLRLTNYSLGQLCTATRAPMELLQRLSKRTAAAVLNESIRSPRVDLSDRSLLIDTSDPTAPRLRASTSERYARVWDAEVFDRVSEWLAPVGYVPATPTFNYVGERPRDIFGDDRPALWSGDRDSFAFFFTGADPNGADFGGLRRGIYVGNSEVGAGSLAWSTFLFRDMCANFLVWGASHIKQRKVRHVGDSRRLFTVYCREIERLAAEVEPLPMQAIAAAAKAAFAGDGSATQKNKDAAAERLSSQFGVNKSTATASVEAALLPQNAARPGEPALSAWTVANGITWEAKDSEFAASLVAGGEIAQRILATV